MEGTRNNNANTRNGKESIGSFLYGFLFFFILRVDSLLFSIPIWLLLIFHFTSGLDIKWFWIALGAFFLIGFLRYALIVFARRCGSEEEPQKENKNPYSKKL